MTITSGSLATGVADRAPEATFGFAESNGPGVDDMVFEPMTDSAWRVLDRRLPLGDPFRVLAVVEYRDDVVQTLQVAERFIWNVFDTFDQALTHLAVTSTSVAAQRLQFEFSNERWERK